MQFRYLGRSGFKISEITYGNWLTHGSQIENDIATACVRAALDVGISTFDTADVYANGAAETVLGGALKGERRESLEVLTKVFSRPAPRDTTTSGCRASTSSNRSTVRCRRLQTDYVDLYQAHRFDYVHAARGDDAGVRRRRALGQGALHRRERVDRGAAPCRCTALAQASSDFQLVSNQPQYSALWRVIEDEVVPTSQELGIGQIVWSPVAQGVLTGKYLPGARAARPAAGRPTSAAARGAVERVPVATTCSRGSRTCADRRGARSVARAARGRVGAAERQRRDGASSAPRGPSRSPRT